MDYSFEPGMRFGVEKRPVIDCAVALHEGVFHLFAPDNGPGVRHGYPGERPREGVCYHATSTDGLSFRKPIHGFCRFSKKSTCIFPPSPFHARGPHGFEQMLMSPSRSTSPTCNSWPPSFASRMTCSRN